MKLESRNWGNSHFALKTHIIELFMSENAKWGGKPLPWFPHGMGQDRHEKRGFEVSDSMLVKARFPQIQPYLVIGTLVEISALVFEVCTFTTLNRQQSHFKRGIVRLHSFCRSRCTRFAVICGEVSPARGDARLGLGIMSQVGIWAGNLGFKRWGVRYCIAPRGYHGGGLPPCWAFLTKMV